MTFCSLGISECTGMRGEALMPRHGEHSHLGAAIVKVRISIVKERIAMFYFFFPVIARKLANASYADCNAVGRTILVRGFTSRAVHRSSSLRPSTLQALFAHGTACERRLDGIFTKYRIDLKIFHHIAIRVWNSVANVRRCYETLIWIQTLVVN